MKTLNDESYIRGGTQKDFYSKDETEKCSCPLCSSNNFKPIHSERGNIGIVDCLNCGLTYVSPRVKDAHMNYWGNPNIYFEEARYIFSNQKSQNLKQIQNLKRC